jgi:hypothetical protein
MKKILLASFAATLSFHASADDAKYGLITGLDYSIGKYGQSENTYIKYVPLTGKLELERWLFRVTVPWVQIDGPSGATGGDSKIILTNNANRRTSESGLGDIVASATYTAIQSSKHKLILDVGAKVKFGSASFKRGLGSGENDYSLQIDAYKLFDKLTFLGTAGYRKLGDPAGIDLNNVWFGTLGAVYKFDPTNNAGIFLDLRQASTDYSTSIREYTLFYSHRFNPTYNLQSYISAGDTLSSVDIGGGVMLGVSW